MAGRTVFKLDFPDGRKSLMISRSKVFDGSKVWMSIPKEDNRKQSRLARKLLSISKTLKPSKHVLLQWSKVTKAEFIQLMQLEKAVKDYEFLNRNVTHAFEFGNIAVLKPRYTRDNLDIVQIKWGFLPKYVKNRAQVEKFRKGYKKKDGTWQKGYDTQNAKGEELLFPDKIYREAALERRCLILSSGFWKYHSYQSRTIPELGGEIKDISKSIAAILNRVKKIEDKVATRSM